MPIPSPDRRRSVRRLFALCLVLPLQGMTTPPATAQTSARGDHPLRLVLELSIGELLGSPARTFNDVGDITVSSDGTIYVLDRGDKQVKVYNREGDFVTAFGREGAGPGEFIRPGPLKLDSLVRVFDFAQRRVSTFTRDGEHRETKALPSIPTLQVTKSYPVKGGGIIALSAARFSLGGPGHDPNIAVVYRHRSGERVDTLLLAHSGGTLWHPIDRMLPWGIADAPFGAGGTSAIHGDSLVAVADGTSGDVAWYRATEDGLELDRKAQLPVRGREVTEDDLAKVEEAFRAAKPSQKSRIELIPPPRWSVASRALFADDGTLWVRSSMDAERGYVWAIFPADGGEVWRMRLPEGFDLRAVRNGRLYGTVKTELDVPVVKVYRMSRE